MEGFVWFNATATVIWAVGFLPGYISKKNGRAIALSTLGIFTAYLCLLTEALGMPSAIVTSVTFTSMGFMFGLVMYFIEYRKRRDQHGQREMD